MRIFNIVLEFRELQKKFFRINMNDEYMRKDVVECEDELKRLKALQKEHMKFIIGQV